MAIWLMNSPVRSGKSVAQRALAHQPEVLPQGLVELEAVAVLRDERPLENVGAAVVRVLRPQADAVADAERFAVDQRDLLIVPVGVVRELGDCDGSLISTLSRPLPTRRTFEARKTELRSL